MDPQPNGRMWVPIYVPPLAIPHLVDSKHKLLRGGYLRLSFSVGPKNWRSTVGKYGMGTVLSLIHI